MNTSAELMYGDMVDSLTSKYAGEGFAMTRSPTANDLPFDLDGYQPDLLAKKAHGGLIIAIKTRARGLSVDRFRSIAQTVAAHPGWQFLLATLDDVDVWNIPTTASELPSWSELIDKHRQVRRLVNAGELEPAVLYLWSILEATLRKRALQQCIPLERLPARMLLDHMVSQGEVPVGQIDLLRDLMQRRNRLAHGGMETVAPIALHQAVETIDGLLQEWSAPETNLAA